MHTRIHACMPTKTISIDLEAYERLRKARLEPGESFSRVIKRASWPEPRRTAGSLVDAFAVLDPADKETLERLEASQAADSPPEDPWRDR